VGRVRQFIGHLTARTGAADEAFAHAHLPRGAWPLFDGMPVADRRHAVDVARHLVRGGRDDHELLAAALLHDAAKGHRMRLWHRVGGVLLDALAPALLRRLASPLPASGGYPWYLYLHHAELSARAAVDAGCSPRTAELIRGRAGEADGDAQAALLAADEAN
jgi:hypothetical protein